MPQFVTHQRSGGKFGRVGILDKDMARQLRAAVDRSVDHRLVLEAAEIDLIHEERIHGRSWIWRQVNQRRQLSLVIYIQQPRVNDSLGELNRMSTGVPS